MLLIASVQIFTRYRLEGFRSYLLSMLDQVPISFIWFQNIPLLGGSFDHRPSRARTEVRIAIIFIGSLKRIERVCMSDLRCGLEVLCLETTSVTGD